VCEFDIEVQVSVACEAIDLILKDPEAKKGRDSHYDHERALRRLNSPKVDRRDPLDEIVERSRT